MRKNMKKIGILLCISICIIFSGCAEEEPSVRDTDGDGIPDTEDAFPNDPSVSKDSDNDGYADEYNDGYNASNSNASIDAFPHDPTEWKDSDGDGYGDETDDFPFDPARYAIITVEDKEYTISQGGEIDTAVDIAGKDHTIVIYWELMGESYNTQAGNALTMRYNNGKTWSSQYNGRSDQITFQPAEDVEQIQIKFMHEGRSESPPYTNSIQIHYRISKIR